MNCPVYGKEARAHIYYFAKCGICVREKCWPEHKAVAHREK